MARINSEQIKGALDYRSGSRYGKPQPRHDPLTTANPSIRDCLERGFNFPALWSDQVGEMGRTQTGATVAGWRPESIFYAAREKPMPNDDTAAVLKQKLKRLLSQDLSEMGYEVKARHRRRVADLTRAYDRARAQVEESAESEEPAATSH